MKIRVRNLISVILHSIIYVLYFVSGFFELAYYKCLDPLGYWRGSRLGQISFAGALTLDFRFNFLGAIALAISSVVIVLLFVQLFGKGSKQNSALCVYTICAEFLFAFAYSFIQWFVGEPHKMNGVCISYSAVEPMALAYVMLGLFIVLCVFVIATFRKYKNRDHVEKSDVLAEDDPAVELAKYHKLFLEGAITEEEFNAKKKQLLEM